MAELICFVFELVTTRNLTVIVLQFANFTNFFLLIWKAIFKRINFTVNHKSSGKMESVTMDVIAEDNQEIQDQTSGDEERRKFKWGGGGGELSACNVFLI